MQVLQGLGKALSAGAIAALLLISVVTVGNHIAKIVVKLDVHTKLEAVLFAQRSRLI